MQSQAVQNVTIAIFNAVWLNLIFVPQSQSFEVDSEKENNSDVEPQPKMGIIM